MNKIFIIFIINSLIVLAMNEEDGRDQFSCNSPFRFSHEENIHLKNESVNSSVQPVDRSQSDSVSSFEDNLSEPCEEGQNNERWPGLDDYGDSGIIYLWGMMRMRVGVRIKSMGKR